MSYLDQYSSKESVYTNEDDWWSIGNTPLSTTKKTNFWSNFGLGGFEDYETRYKRKIIEKTTSIFADLKRKPIQVQLGSQQTRIVSQAGSYVMEVANYSNKEEEEISTKTKVERALAHVLAETPKVSMQNLANTMINDIPENYQLSVVDCIMASFGALEDRRSQVMYGDIYNGARQRFKQANTKEGQVYQDIIPDNPILALQMAEKGRYDLVQKSKYKNILQYLKQVEKTTPKGSVALTKKMYDKIIKPWITKILKDLPPMPQSPQGKGKEEDKDQQDGKSPQQGQQGQDSQDKQQKSKQKSKGMSREELQKILNDALTSRHKSDHEMLEEDYKVEAEISGSNMNKVDLDKEELDYEKMVAQAEKNLEDLEKSGEQEHGDGFTEDRMIGPIYVRKNDITSKPEQYIDLRLVRRLKRTFKRIQGSEKLTLSDEGTEIDVESLIDARVKGHGSYMLEDNPTVGFDIFIGVDGSSSMGSRVETVRRMIATMLKALEETPKVRMQVIAWKQGGGLTINKITKPEEVINMNSAGGTPFGKAMWYMHKVIRQSTARRKVFFMITDGEIGGWDAEQGGVVATKLRKNKVKTIGIYVGSNTVPPMLETSFGKGMSIGCHSIRDLDKLLTRDITSMVVRHLKNV